MKKLVNGKFLYDVVSADKVLYWQVIEDITLDEVKTIIESVKKDATLLKNDILLLVDNSKLVNKKGDPIVFKQDVFNEWQEFQGWLIPHCKSVAVACNSAIMKMQMDRMARSSGLPLKSFYDDDRLKSIESSIQYLNIDKNKVRSLF